MHPTRRVRAAVAGAALSTALALGMAGAAYAQEGDVPPAELSCDTVAEEKIPAAAVWAIFEQLNEQERLLLDPEKTGRPCGLEPLSGTSAGNGSGTDSGTGDDDSTVDGGGNEDDESETTSPKPSTEAPDKDRNCADFTSQAEAQAAFDKDKSDPDNLDADDDEIACEDHFDTEDSQVAVKPKGGVATGGDGR